MNSDALICRNSRNIRYSHPLLFNIYLPSHACRARRQPAPSIANPDQTTTLPVYPRNYGHE
jgi:hypothetical protein